MSKHEGPIDFDATAIEATAQLAIIADQFAGLIYGSTEPVKTELLRAARKVGEVASHTYLDENDQPYN